MMARVRLSAAVESSKSQAEGGSQGPASIRDRNKFGNAMEVADALPHEELVRRMVLA